MPHENVLSYFAKYIEAELGIIYAEHNYYQLQNRLEEIAKTLKIPTLDELLAIAQKGMSLEFKKLLLDSATNNETSFFRDTKAFETIEQFVFQTCLDLDPKAQSLRVWSAASSTGQEALSIAILYNEWAQKMGVKVPLQITATDICERVLDRLKAASYTQLEIQRGLSKAQIEKYFKKDDQEKWIASPLLTKTINAQKLNLLFPFSFPYRFQFVLCRNVLIYQNIENKKKILQKIADTLMPGGVLMMGSGESLLGLSDAFQQDASHGSVVYLKKK